MQVLKTYLEEAEGFLAKSKGTEQAVLDQISLEEIIDVTFKNFSFSINKHIYCPGRLENAEASNIYIVTFCDRVSQSITNSVYEIRYLIQFPANQTKLS